MQIPTVKIAVGEDYRVINKSDFDPDIMSLWEDPEKEEASGEPDEKQMVLVKNPSDRRQRMEIERSVYEKNPTAWELS